VHSYISSSNPSRPAGPWLFPWIVGVALAANVLCGIEYLYRNQGYQPTVIDNKLLWSCHRQTIYPEGDKQTVVLLGASQIQLGFTPRVFEQQFPKYHVVNLAINGAYPFAALRDLADDENFNGIVICSIHARGFHRDHRQDQQPHVDYYHQEHLGGFKLDEKINRSVSTILQSRFVILNPTLRLDEFMGDMIRDRSLPPPHYVITHSDRSRAADFTRRLDLVAHRRRRIDQLRESYEEKYFLTPEDWLGQAMEIEPFVQAIQRRGGQVVFVRYITTEKHYELDQKYYPKQEYWDQFAKKTNAVTVHFADVPELSGFNCPDTNHLDFRDAPFYTIALGNELCRLNVIQP
jgi:hypothetical protein